MFVGPTETLVKQLANCLYRHTEALVKQFAKNVCKGTPSGVGTIWQIVPQSWPAVLSEAYEIARSLQYAALMGLGGGAGRLATKRRT